MAQNGVMIIGSGLAGYGVAREFRKASASGPLTILTADDGASYSKPQLSVALAAGKSPDQLVLKDAAAMAKDLGAGRRPADAELGGDDRVTDAGAGWEVAALDPVQDLAVHFVAERHTRDHRDT